MRIRFFLRLHFYTIIFPARVCVSAVPPLKDVWNGFKVLKSDIGVGNGLFYNHALKIVEAQVINFFQILFAVVFLLLSLNVLVAFLVVLPYV